jgi:hypothetical protein
MVVRFIFRFKVRMLPSASFCLGMHRSQSGATALIWAMECTDQERMRACVGRLLKDGLATSVNVNAKTTCWVGARVNMLMLESLYCAYTT